MTKDDIRIPLEPENFYHIFNRVNNGEVIFYHQENYYYFLKKYDHYLSDYVNTYCYCLLPNHFHFLIRVKSASQIKERVKIDFPNLEDLENLNASWCVSERFRRFFLSYAKSINKQESRKGSLFQKYFRRKKVHDDAYFSALVWYIHNNPVHHKIAKNLTSYPWSSYQRMLSNKPSKLMKKEVIDWFGSKEQYIDFHHQNDTNFEQLRSLIIE